MIAVLLHLALASAGSSTGSAQVPVEAPIPPAIATTDVPVCVQLTRTHFVAQSFVDEMQWLVFVNEECELRCIRSLGPHERALLPVVAGAADGMSVEIITRSDSGSFLTSGAIDCALLAGNTIYFNRKGDRFIGWVPHHGGRSLTRAKVGRSTLPHGIVRVVQASATLPVFAEEDSLAVHVPVPTPAENRKRDKSRRLKRKKLPPV